MNKTININLAGIFFHIDENAFLKLENYLQAIKRSFTYSEDKDEIIADIEARISELFNEKIKDKKQVISISEVEEVIKIMGQPEDYKIDEEIFEDEPKSTFQPKVTKQLFRDTSNSYIGGVTSGLGHYIVIDPTWVRLAWVLLTIFSSGAFIIIYIVLWIFVPEAKTTADKLAMKGKQINISNIEKKFKEKLNDVTDTVKNVDYQKYSDKVKNNSTSFFESFKNVTLTILEIFIKVVGVFTIILSGIALISLFIALFIIGIFGMIDTPWLEYIQTVNTSDAPFWLISLLLFFAIGIPFLSLFTLGLRIMIKNLKPIGTPTKLGLSAIWILSIIGLSFIGIKKVFQESFDDKIISEKQILPFTNKDTLTIKMANNNSYLKKLRHRNGFKIKKDEKGNKVIVIRDIELFLKASKKDTVASIIIEKKAEGNTYEIAKKKAQKLNHYHL